ncbi:mandelate racemase/muconate lactonizing enzyme family protein [Microbacterium oryzae]|uniref:mandelate racemase/muconate lactonizing enzyme family protein n=1 Tax=Microbacterium oryzae TaxID=743009 RepID=UPI0025AFE1AC|nr:mandelate racemase/muconate lactonizing enzyme family protein [Microbacterium oryzae]MDN3312021.1 mandelate racemase/muconate lactonizing enzyme family protein [Microbacterium oryzae]
MKITAVETFVLSTTLPRPFAYSQGWVTARSTTVVKVTTDEGHVGWGETFSVGLQPPQIAASVIDNALAPLVVGRDPLQTDVIWDDLYVRTRDFGRTGVVVGAISAIDIALWDIRGKAAGLPVWKLLGGAFRDRVQCYATGFFRLQGQHESAEMAEEAARHADDGHTLMKIKLGFGLADDIVVMNAIRDAVGDRSGFMIDVNHGYGPNDAIRLATALEDFGLRWIEEPVIPEDLSGYRRVRDAIRTPVAGGEAEFTLYGFAALFAAQGVDIAQPDICLAGGFTALKHINVLAQSHGVQVNPHVWGTAIGQYASLHALANTPTTHPGLYADQPLFEYDTSSHPFRTALVSQPLQHEDGYLAIPDGAGLGFELDEDFLRAHAVEQ